MTCEIERSLFRLALSASAHSQRFGLSRYSLAPLANDQIIDIGRDLMRLFEERYEVEIKMAPSGSPSAPSGQTGGVRTRQRPRTQ